MAAIDVSTRDDATDVLNDVPIYTLDMLGVNTSEKLGSGGWGSVYRAKNLNSLGSYAGNSAFHTLVPAGSDLCIKIFHTKKELSSQLILREIRNHAILSGHENVATLHGYGLDPVTQATFVVMPLYSGGSLEDLILARARTFDQDGPDEEDAWWSEVFVILLGVAEALAHLEQKWFVHRDVKPANILVSADLEQVVLSDFGLATSLDELQAFADKSPKHRAQACRMGTPMFIAPELRTRRSVDADAAQLYKPFYLPSFKSDIWSFGLVAYACAGVSMEFPGEGVFDTSPQWLQDLISHCTRDEPELRPCASTVVEWLKTRGIPSTNM